MCGGAFSPASFFWHHDQIKRFGRFPGRNRALGRVNSAEEREVIVKGETF